MKKLFAAAILLSSVTTFATESLVGTYEFSGYECASGKKPYSILSSEFINISIKGDADFTKDKIKFDFTMSMKATEKYGEITLGPLREELADAEKLTDQDVTPAEKAAIIKDIKLQMAYFEKLVAGDSCALKSEMTYTVENDHLTSTTESFETTCEDMEDDTGNMDVQIFSVEGDVLKLKNTPEGKGDGKDLCSSELDDQTVMVFKKK